MLLLFSLLPFCPFQGGPGGGAGGGAGAAMAQTGPRSLPDRRISGECAVTHTSLKKSFPVCRYPMFFNDWIRWSKNVKL